MASNETLTGSETMARTLEEDLATQKWWHGHYMRMRQLAGDRMLVIGMIASALDIEDLETAHDDPAVILQAIEDLKGKQ